MSDTATSPAITINLEPPRWSILAIAIYIGVANLAGLNPIAAKIVHSIFLCGHLITFCIALLYGIWVQTRPKNQSGFGIWILVIPFEALIVLCGSASRFVLFDTHLPYLKIRDTTFISGFGILAGLFFLHFLHLLNVLHVCAPRDGGGWRSRVGIIRGVRRLIRDCQRPQLGEKFNALIASKNYREALEVLQPELKCKYPDAYFLFRAGWLHLELGQAEEGIRLFQDCLSKSDRDSYTIAMVAWTYHIYNRLDLGQPLIDEAKQKDDRNLIVSLIRCQYLISAGHLDEARGLWSQVKDTTDPSAQSLLKEPAFQKGIERLDAQVDSVTGS